MSAGPSTSPPRTPEDRGTSRPNPSPPTSDDSSIIEDLSFDYVFDQNGDFVRLSTKGGASTKSNHSSPPTPQEAPLEPDPLHGKPPSPDLLVSPMGRISLSRSESAFPVLSGNSGAGSSTITQNDKPGRSFQRVASGPVTSTTPSYLAPTASSMSKPRVVPRRITNEDNRERADSLGASRVRQVLEANAHALQEEKENISESDDLPRIQTASVAIKQRSSPPLVTRSVSAASTRMPSARAAYLSNGASSANSRPAADMPLSQRVSHGRQILPGPNRAGRVMKSSSGTKYGVLSSAPAYDRISEVESSENELGGSKHSPMAASVNGEETDPEEEPVATAESAVAPLSSVIQSGTTARSRAQALSINVNSALAGSTGLSTSGNTRPRRSHSLSDALNNDEYQLQLQQQFQNSSSRPGTSLGMHGDNVAGARRVTAQERERQDMEMRAEIQKYRTQEDAEPKQPRQSPSPTHNQQSSRSTYGHRRRDSDTLRGLGPSSATTGSPTVVESRRDSPPLQSSRLQVRYSPSGTTKGRVSPPTAKGRSSPPTARGRLSPAITAGREVAKHRRSPTAPDPSTTSGMIRDSNALNPVGKTWAGARGATERERAERDDDYDYGGVGERERERDGERERERDSDRERERDRRGHQSHLSLQQASQQPYSQSAPSIPAAQAAVPTPGLNRHIVVNRKAYARLDMIGKGGSSRVFRVLNHANELYAIKRVSLDKTDAETMSGYMNEIALLKRLEGNNRIIRLIDSEVKPGPGGSKGHLLLVMECGEIDMARLLQEQMKEPVNMVWVAYYWQQMLQAVTVIHEEKIVHSDLKPANFVLVRGQLKLIDFGIANAIANDTTNIQRDHQVGTVNYMSPETIEVPDGMRALKVGRPSDVWSLGCILYQMVYGHPPFQHLSMIQKMKAIPDLTHVIEFAEYATPILPSPRNSVSGNGQVEPPRKLDHLKQRVRKDVIGSMKSCLCRNPKERATIPELLNHGWLSMRDPTTDVPPIKELLKEDETVINPYYMRQLLDYGIRLARGHEDNDPALAHEALLKEAERLVQELKSIQP